GNGAGWNDAASEPQSAWNIPIPPDSGLQDARSWPRMPASPLPGWSVPQTTRKPVTAIRASERSEERNGTPHSQPGAGGHTRPADADRLAHLQGEAHLTSRAAIGSGLRLTGEGGDIPD
ncbi:MAG: hypothetical protein V3U45_01170, partial [bacterium]